MIPCHCITPNFIEDELAIRFLGSPVLFLMLVRVISGPNKGFYTQRYPAIPRTNAKNVESQFNKANDQSKQEFDHIIHHSFETTTAKCALVGPPSS